jgi:hypothetical protein
VRRPRVITRKNDWRLSNYSSITMVYRGCEHKEETVTVWSHR